MDLSSSQVVINPMKIFPPIEASVLECMNNKSIVNFLSFIPEPLHPHSLDILENHVLPNLHEDKDNASNTANNGTIIIPSSLDYAFYISSHMYKSIYDDSIPKWINEHAVTTAKRVFQEISSKNPKAQNAATQITISSSRSKKKSTSHDVEQEDDMTIMTSTTNKKKRRNKKKNESSEKNIEASDTNPLPPDVIIPLHELAKLLAKKYPDFLTIHANLGYDEVEYDDDIKSWIHSNDEIINEQEYEHYGPIHYFLQHLYEHIKTLSVKVYQQEYDQLQALSLQTAINSNTLNISPKMKQKIISSFEDSTCFATSCHWIQLLDKSFTYLDQHLSSDKTVVHVQNIIATDFAKRITQYCMFIHDIPLDIFSFEDGNSKKQMETKLKKHSQSSPNLPSFCQPVNTSNYQSSSDSTFLSCSSSPRDPLQVLREELSNGIGVALARMWIFTGSKHYQQRENINQKASSINWESFLLHLDSNVYLFTNGIPFKKMDKKSEKKLLFERKCTLMQVLSSMNYDEEDDTYHNHAKAIISVVIILLFQQIKHVIITPDFLFHEGDSSADIIGVLLKSDKIPEKVRDDSLLLYNLIQDEKEDELSSNKDLVDRVKSYGLCRDISKA